MGTRTAYTRKSGARPARTKCRGGYDAGGALLAQQTRLGLWWTCGRRTSFDGCGHRNGHAAGAYA